MDISLPIAESLIAGIGDLGDWTGANNASAIGVAWEAKFSPCYLIRGNMQALFGAHSVQIHDEFDYELRQRK